MIQALHDRGISVVMDVVYNHTFSTDSCFNRTVPGYYYRMNSSSAYSNGSGCGNETASDKLMYRKYMIESESIGQRNTTSTVSVLTLWVFTISQQ